ERKFLPPMVLPVANGVCYNGASPKRGLEKPLLPSRLVCRLTTTRGASFMTISISCPACGAPYNLNDQMRGKTVRCKSCQDTFTVNGSSKPAPAGIKKGGAPAETKPAPRAMPPARGGQGDPDDLPGPESGGGKVALSVGGVIGVIFLLCCGGVGLFAWHAYSTGKDAVDQFNKEYAEQVKKGQGGNPFDSKEFDAAMKKAEEEMNRQMAQQG